MHDNTINGTLKVTLNMSKLIFPVSENALLDKRKTKLTIAFYVVFTSIVI